MLKHVAAEKLFHLTSQGRMLAHNPALLHLTVGSKDVP
jgi:hypothetical protein